MVLTEVKERNLKVLSPLIFRKAGINRKIYSQPLGKPAFDKVLENVCSEIVFASCMYFLSITGRYRRIQYDTLENQCCDFYIDEGYLLVISSREDLIPRVS